MKSPHDEMKEGLEAPPPGVRLMAVVRWGLVVAMAFVAIISITLYFRGNLHATHGDSDQTYHCPMHPQIRQDHPGDCPICGMTLILRPQGAQPEKKSTEVPDLVAIDLTPDRIQRIGVRTARVSKDSIRAVLRLVGVVQANERGLARIAPRVSGFIEEVRASETGQRVKRGEILATLFSPELLQAQQELLTAQGWDSQAKADSHSTPGSASIVGLTQDARRRLEYLGVAEPEIAQLLRSRTPMHALPLRSPIAGYVVTKLAVQGMNVPSGSVLFEVADLSTIWIQADVPEADMGKVAIGQTATIAVLAFSGERLTGRVRFLSPTVDVTSRTLRVRIELRNPSGPGGLKLRPGMSATVDLDGPEQVGLWIPTEAVADTGRMTYVFVAKPEGRFEPRRVKLGTRVDERVVVLQGLAEGEAVVTTSAFLLDSESRLRAVAP